MGAAIAFDCACSVLLSQLVRLRRSSALCGCPSCVELDQAENNPRVTLLPLRVTDRDKWEKGDDIPRVQEKIMAKPQKILSFVQRQRKKRFLLPKDVTWISRPPHSAMEGLARRRGGLVVVVVVVVVVVIVVVVVVVVVVFIYFE